MSDKKLSNKAQRVQAALAEFGLDLVVMEFPEFDPHSARSCWSSWLPGGANRQITDLPTATQWQGDFDRCQWKQPGERETD